MQSRSASHPAARFAPSLIRAAAEIHAPLFFCAVQLFRKLTALVVFADVAFSFLQCLALLGLPKRIERPALVPCQLSGLTPQKY
jgi:hypothetical protein